ncbi:MAG TPA: hypothetical protein VNT20_16445 [Flavisolibacter sp.]|nr:hypothetical protein [Flavisolibacter sp.]
MIRFSCLLILILHVSFSPGNAQTSRRLQLTKNGLGYYEIDGDATIPSLQHSIVVDTLQLVPKR